MPKDDFVFVNHMLEMARKANSKALSVTREEFDKNENLRLAITHLLQIIGEAAARVSAEFRDNYPQIP